MWRYFGMFLLACTGIGAIYLIARTYRVAPGNVGVVENQGKYERLLPGLHCLVSPLRWFIKQVPGPERQVQVTKEFTLHTADSIEATAKVIIRYVTNDAIKAASNVSGDYQNALLDATETAMANIIIEENYTFRGLSSAQPLQPERIDNVRADGAIANGNFLGKLSALLLNKINTICSHWGISVLGVQLVNMSAKDPAIEKEIEHASTGQFTANNKLLAAKTEQEAARIAAETAAIKTKREAVALAENVKIIAQGKADAARIEAAAKVERAALMRDKLGVSPEAQLKRENDLEMSQAFSQTRGTVAFGSMGIFGQSNQAVVDAIRLENLPQLGS